MTEEIELFIEDLLKGEKLDIQLGSRPAYPILAIHEGENYTIEKVTPHEDGTFEIIMRKVEKQEA